MTEYIITIQLALLAFLSLIFILVCFDFFAENMRPKDAREQVKIGWSITIAGLPFMIIFITFINPQIIARYITKNIAVQSIWMGVLLLGFILTLCYFKASKQKQSALWFIILITGMLFVYYLTGLSLQQESYFLMNASCEEILEAFPLASTRSIPARCVIGKGL